MKIHEVREKPTDELLHDLHEFEVRLMQLRFERVTERELRPSEYRQLRRDIARIKTVLRERELGINRQRQTTGGKQTNG